nr:MAG TPA: hypothetical protein [Caudoviricetes sp.]
MAPTRKFYYFYNENPYGRILRYSVGRLFEVED